ncbi:hypothetical protein AB0H45_23225 [Streptomyces atroolivaceus]|uniref:hypothetical protein n=1 Tax=Streptomyces atroolivaceus TaxID=66869 RepID=UPI003402AD57
MNTSTDTSGRSARRGAPVIEQSLGGPPSVRTRMGDGIETGPGNAPTVHVRPGRALRRLRRHPGGLGPADGWDKDPGTVPAQRAEAVAADRVGRGTGAGR